MQENSSKELENARQYIRHICIPHQEQWTNTWKEVRTSTDGRHGSLINVQVFLQVLEQKNQVQLDPPTRQLIVSSFQEPNGLISFRKFLKWIDLSRPLDLVDPDLICPKLPQPYRRIMKIFEQDILTKTWLQILDNEAKKPVVKPKKISSLRMMRSFVGSEEMDDLESAKNRLCPPTNVLDANTSSIQFISAYSPYSSKNTKIPFHLVTLAHGVFQVAKGSSSTSTAATQSTGAETRILQEFQPFGATTGSPANVKIQNVSPLMIRKTSVPGMLPDHGLYVAVTLQQEISSPTPGVAVSTYSSVYLYRLAMEDNLTGFNFDVITVMTIPEANIQILNCELACDVSFIALVTSKKQLIVHELGPNLFDKSRWSNLNFRLNTLDQNGKAGAKAAPASKPADNKRGSTTAAVANPADNKRGSTTAAVAVTPLVDPSVPTHVLDLKEPPRISAQLDKTSGASRICLKFLMACTSKNTSTSRINGLVVTNGIQLLKYSLENNPTVYNWLHLYPITSSCIDSSTQFAFTAQSNGSVQVWNVLDHLDHMTMVEPIVPTSSLSKANEVDTLIIYKQEYLASLNKSSQKIIFYELHLQERQVKVLRMLDFKDKATSRILSIHQLTVDLPMLVVALSNGRVMLFDMRNAEALASLRLGSIGGGSTANTIGSSTTNTTSRDVEYHFFQTNEQLYFHVYENQQPSSFYEYGIKEILLACAPSFESVLKQRNMEKSLVNVKRLFCASTSRMGMGLGLGLNVMTAALDSNTPAPKAFEIFKPAQQQALYNALTKNSTTPSSSSNTSLNRGPRGLMSSDSNTTMKTSHSRATTKITNSNTTLPGTSSHTSIGTATTSPTPGGSRQEEKDFFSLPQVPEVDFHPKKLSLEEKMDSFYREELPHATTAEKENRLHRRRNDILKTLTTW